MNLEIQSIWSPDLNPPSEGYPEDVFDFEVLLQVSIGEVGKPGGEVFALAVCSSKALLKTESGEFLNNTLVIEKFDWMIIQNRITKLLSFCQSASSWKEVILRLSGCLRYSDEEVWNL